ncbi:ferritin-like domain-containing protein [Catenuloplanes indicus]|uniref:DUF2202 domain-containing protein n=1 Tax=Catenuloplanes indicus TaxID=137267 RepID=A0AAE3VTR4_9ACTN|nr:DUF2202 domain-containing protein [Catenuloplanes indicus]MDQ0363551.1 hypothetical protein [Catenuloplanes indicus]
MNTITRRAATLVAAGVLGLEGLAVAAPTLAGGGPFGGPGPASPAVTDRPGPWLMGGPGMGQGHGRGACAGRTVTAAQGSLTDAQRVTLASLAQEEKLAHDLYAAFAARYDAVVFDHVAAAESRHLDAMRTLLSRYRVTDPTAGRPAGTFTDPAVQARYDDLLARGAERRSAALAVARQAERDDIAALTAALNGLTAPDARQVYTHLLAASERHLIAFTRWPRR